MMEKEYTISTFTKIFYTILAAVLIGFCFFLCGVKSADVSDVVYILPLCIFAFGIWLLAKVFRSKIIISDQSIFIRYAFTEKELLISEIKGSRIGNRYFVIEPLSPLNKSIVVNNYDNYSDSEDILAWAKRLKDLDAENLKHEKEERLNDLHLGTSTEERILRVRNSKRIAISYNIIGMSAAVSLIFNDSALILILINALYPLTGILLMAISVGLIKFLSNSKQSIRSFTMLGISLPSFMLFIVSMDRYDFVIYTGFWVPFIGIGLIFFLMLYFTGINRSVEAVKMQIVVMAVISLLYAAGLTIQINCLPDKSPPYLFHAVVVDKNYTTGKGASDFLYLSPWGPKDNVNRVTVSRTVYNGFSKGDSINVCVKKGVLNIPWFYLSK